jgi:hypothetical protein
LSPALRRLGAAIALLVVLVLYQPGGPTTVVNELLLPLLGGLAAWALVGSTLAIALTVGILAAAHTDLDANHWLEARLYPAATLLAGGVCAVTLGRRFRSWMRLTRAERARARAARRAQAERDP